MVDILLHCLYNAVMEGMFMKKTISLLFAVVLVCGVFAGCGGSSTSLTWEELLKNYNEVNNEDLTDEDFYTSGFPDSTEKTGIGEQQNIYTAPNQACRITISKKTNSVIQVRLGGARKDKAAQAASWIASFDRTLDIASVEAGIKSGETIFGNISYNEVIDSGDPYDDGIYITPKDN